MGMIELKPVRVKAGLKGDLVVAEGRWGSLSVSEPPEMGGRDDLPSPLDLLVASLATCEVFMAKMIAAKLGLKPGSIEVEVEGSFSVGEGLREASIVFKFSGLNKGEAEKVVEMVKSLCPIYATVAKEGVKLKEEIVVVEESRA